MKKHSGIISLYIDTSDSETTSVRLSIDGNSFEKVSKRSNFKSQVLLPLIEELLRETHTSLEGISEIQVHTGPGSFTGLRIGITVAQIFGDLLNIPVNGKKAGDVTPYYKDSQW